MKSRFVYDTLEFLTLDPDEAQAPSPKEKSVEETESTEAA